MSRIIQYFLKHFPQIKKLSSVKWVNKIKYKSYGSIERYKALLIATGYNQIASLNYYETFAPTAKLTTVNTLLVVVVVKKWELHQLDF